MRIRVVVADDHKVFLEGLCSLLGEEKGLEVVATARDGVELLEAVRLYQPDIVISDISMPRLNGIEATKRLAEEFPNCRVIILSMHKDGQMVRQMLQNHAYGFLLKECCFDELTKALHEVMDGKVYLSDGLQSCVLQDYIKQLHDPSLEAAQGLSSREREVLHLIAEGNSTKDIANKLYISVKTVETYRRQIMVKTKIHSVAGLTKFAIREGFSSL